MNALLPPPVPAQYRGLARAFCRRVGQEEAAANAWFNQCVLEPLRHRYTRRPGRSLRDGTLYELATAWQDRAPAAFRLGFHAEIEPRGRHGRMLELRLLQSLVRQETWHEDVYEPGCTIIAEFMKVYPKGAKPPKEARLQRAVLGLHALGRHYQRCSDHSDAALLEDLQALANSPLHDQEQYPVDETFRIATPRGAWVGTTTAVEFNDRERVCFNVRTFID